MASGALYHLDYIAADMLLGLLSLSSLDSLRYSTIVFLSFFLTFLICFEISSLGGMERANPKSQSITRQSLLSKKLDGLMSRWIRLAEWMKFREHSILYNSVFMCPGVISVLGVILSMSEKSS